MPAVVKNKLLLYADDSAILVSERDRSSLEKSLSEDRNLVRLGLLTINCHCTLAKRILSFLVQSKS